MGEIFIKKEKLNGLLQLASQKTGIPAKELQEKIEPYLKDGGLTLPAQLGSLLQDPQKMEQLLRSKIVADLLSGQKKAPPHE